MELAAVHTLYDALAGGGTVFLYSGSFHDEHTVHLISLGEQMVAGTDMERSMRNKLGFIMVESYQNIIRHRAQLGHALETGAGRSVFLVRERNAMFEVVAINAIPDDEAQELRSILARIDGHDQKQLKEMFLRALQSGKTTERGGAGLGLIEMARRSGHALWHRLYSIGHGHGLFSLRVVVGSGEVPMKEEDPFGPLHQAVVDLDILLLTKGRLSPGLQKTIVDLITKDLDPGVGRADTWTRSYLAATEFLEGATVDGSRPLVMIARSTNGHSFVIGGDMRKERVDLLEQEVASINNMDGFRLQGAYRNALLGRGELIGPGSLGLLDLARRKVAPVALSRKASPHGERVLVEVVV